METKNKLEQKIKEMDLKVGDPIKITFKGGESSVGYFGKRNKLMFSYDSSLKSVNDYLEGVWFSYLNSIEKITKLYEMENLELSLEDFLKSSLQESEKRVVEIETEKSDYSQKDKKIGYFEGFVGKDFVLLSRYERGTPWYEKTSGDGPYIPAIKSIKILGEKNDK